MIHITDILERVFREVPRRTRPMGVFTNAESAERIICGIAQHLDANWQKLRFEKFNRPLDATAK